MGFQTCGASGEKEGERTTLQHACHEVGQARHRALSKGELHAYSNPKTSVCHQTDEFAIQI
eukprot:2894528-Amphidinium_carterae.1